MTLKRAILAASALLILAAPVTASADPWWGGHDAGEHDGWRDGGDGDWRDHGRRDDEGRDRGWRDHGWRAHERWEHGGWGGYGYHARCYWTDQGYYNWWGQYEYRPVRICR